VDFLGHVLSQERVRPNPKKNQSTKKWQRLMLTKGVRSLLGLANFYKNGHKGFFDIGQIDHLPFEERGII
jgi:hypothetical protein